ncbi:hypothetical protein AGMMS49587_06180 [Spirochaetia bacterium]|nr:hypothetical protein AGMMS49587_06180 [Spirochaetia bacterium]
MKIRRRSIFILAAIILILAFLAGFFFSRSPALILSDASFDALYGPRRALIAQARLSLGLFRPVKKVLLAESAGPDAAVFALEEASRRPFGAILPARYGRGGQRYAEAHPDVPVAVIEGRGRGGANIEENLRYIAADAGTDAYRAGRCAAILAQAGGAADGDGGGILFFQDEQNFPFNRESFLAGLREEGFMKDPVFLSLNSNYSSYENISCVVLTGASPHFLDRNIKVPVILFSWLDPALTSANVRLVFDDSPWALAFRAFRAEKSLPSDIIIQEKRIEDPEALRKIKTAVRGEIPE